jgi:CRP-like cAMP-binding protein
MDRNTLKALQLCPLFLGFAPEEICFALEKIPYRFVRFEKKEFYILAGTPCKYVDIVVHGEMSVRIASPSGKSMQVNTKSMGSLLAPSFIFAKDNAIPVSMECTKPTTLLRMAPEMLQRLMDNDQRIRENFILQLSNTCNYMAAKVRMLTLHTVREKVAIFLLQEAKRNNSDTFTLTKSRQEIADSFAVQKFSLQRSLKEFAEEEIISLDGKHISILKKDELISIAES